MPNLDTTRRDIETHVKNFIDGVVIPIAYENLPFDGNDTDYAYLSLHFTGSSNVNINGINNKRIRHTGFISFKVYTKIGTGTSSSLKILDEIKTQVENKYISSNLITYAAEPIRKGIGKEGFYSNFLNIPFVSDEC